MTVPPEAVTAALEAVRRDFGWVRQREPHVRAALEAAAPLIAAAREAAAAATIDSHVLFAESQVMHSTHPDLARQIVKGMAPAHGCPFWPACQS